MDHPPLLTVTDFGGHSPSYVGLSVSDYSSPVTGNESVRGEISFSRRLRSIGGGSITQSFGHSVRKRAQQAARTFRFAIARRRSSASWTVYHIFDCHEATKIGGGIRNIPRHATRTTTQAKGAACTMLLPPGIRLLHPCYAHMAASRSMQLFKLAYDPITRGQASRLARQPAPQYLSRIYIRSRWILFCTS